MKHILCLLLMLHLAHALQIQSIKADFIMQLKEESGAIEYSGNLIASADSRAYWKYNKPIKKEIFISKAKTIIYEPMLHQVIIHRHANIDFVQIINSAVITDNELTSEINGIIFHVYLKNNKPYKISYVDELDNDIEITLQNVVLNEKIDNKVFEFLIPEDVDIITD